MNNIMRVWILIVFVWSVSLVPNISKAKELNEKITKDLEFKNGIAFLPNENEPFTGTFASHLVKISPQDQLKLEKLLQDLEKLNKDNAHQVRNRLLEDGCVSEFAKRIMSAEPYGYITSNMLWSDDSYSEQQYKSSDKPKPKNKGGRKCYEEHYVGGLLDGLRTSWWSNGHKMNETMYRTGKPDGISYSWFENGQPSGQLSYKRPT